MPTVSGVLETALYVEDLERARRFYQDLFGFETLVADARICALNVVDKQVLLLFRKGASSGANVMPGGTIPPHDGDGRLHFAFAIPAEELAAWEERLAAHGVPIESKIRMQYGGISLYFRDPDGHLVELATPGVWAIY
ncbi:MAG TPA: VOC family protein [Chthonomonadaceae bacterium]|jgi:catechol 2,3-dioxygenase-like lactoylglutathione lyase family enzyme|nr:VOC family protein [Chthonomonadaceae bacterium]